MSLKQDFDKTTEGIERLFIAAGQAVEILDILLEHGGLEKESANCNSIKLVVKQLMSALGR